MADLHPVLVRAADGVWPAWAVIRGDSRRQHLASVVSCLDRWARALELSESDRLRWQAAGWLHDSLRDAGPESFDPAVAPEWPPQLRHGPAAAARLAEEGVEDAELLNAVAYHTTGYVGFRALGRFLYLADYLEPGRRFRPAWRAALRAQLPDRVEVVLREVAGLRIARTLRHGRPLLRETVEFWNGLVRMG